MLGKGSIAKPVQGNVPSKRHLALGQYMTDATERDSDGSRVYTPAGRGPSQRRKRLGWFVVGALVLVSITLNVVAFRGDVRDRDLVNQENKPMGEAKRASSWLLWPEELTLRYYFQRLGSIVGGGYAMDEERKKGQKEKEVVGKNIDAISVSGMREGEGKEGEGRAEGAAAAASAAETEGGVPPLSPPRPQSDISHHRDTDAALIPINEKVPHRQEEAAGRPQEEKGEDEEEVLVEGKENKGERNEDGNEEQEAGAKTGEGMGPVTQLRYVIEEKRNPAIPRVQPAGDKSVRIHFSSRSSSSSSSRPPLHRPASETHIQKILLTISSTDRGQRIADMWQGDKLDTILQTLGSAKGLCERGFDLTVWFIAAWEISLEKKRVDQALFCERVGKPVETRYWDHYPSNIGALLSSRHRLAMAEVFDEYDFFISIEDDMYVTPYHFDSYLHASSQLALTTDPFALEHYLAGFSRKEHDKNNQVHEGEWAIWETDAKDYTAIELKGAGWWGKVSGNPHQGMWMATREQVMNLDMRCKDGFIHLRNPDKADWVEFWSGALQLYDSPAYCEGLRKVLPLDDANGGFESLTVWHMTDSKLHSRGKGVTPVREVIAYLEDDKARKIAGRKERVDG